MDHWDLSGQKATLRQATGAQQAGVVSRVTLGAVSGAMVRQADKRAHVCSQWHSQWFAGAGGSVQPRCIIPVRGATLRRGSHWGHLGPKGQGSHTQAERSLRGTLGQAWSVGATQGVGQWCHTQDVIRQVACQSPHLSQ